MIRRASAIAVSALVLCTAVPSAAVAQQDIAGQWRCQQANQSLNNNAFENWIYRFALALQANGTFQAQGNYTAQTNGFDIPFYAEGRWSQEQGSIVVKGIEQQQGGPTQNFFLLFTNVTARQMSNQYQGGSGKLLTYCER